MEILRSSFPSFRLGDIARIDRQIVAPENICTGTNYVGLENIDSSGSLSFGELDEGDILSAKFEFRPDHILYGRLRPYLVKITRPMISGVCSTDILPIQVGKGVERNYLYYFLRHPVAVAEATLRSVGVNLPRVSPSTLLDFQIPLPPIEEQRRIAAILDKADAIRRKRQDALALTEQLLRSTFLEMFGDPVTNSKGWTTVELRTLAEVSGGLQVSHKRADLPVEVPYLRVANVLRDYIVLNEVKSMRVSASELARARLHAGDVLVVEGHGNADEIGRAATWIGEVTPCVHQNHLIRLRPRLEKITTGYLCSYLNSGAGRRHMARVAKTTSGLNTITVSDVSTLAVAIPPLERQVHFDNRAARARKLAGRLGLHLEAADALFASLSHRAFTGQL